MWSKLPVLSTEPSDSVDVVHVSEGCHDVMIVHGVSEGGHDVADDDHSDAAADNDDD